jgi:predicted amidophosphoribosyltransferase
MFDNTTQRPCPHCGRSINWAATRCGYCWLTVNPLTRDEAAQAELPCSNQREAFRLAKERDSSAIEALLNERDRLREEAAR